MPSKKRKYNARFPAGRIKKIMQTDEEVGKVAQAVPIIISRTLELFVESLLKKAMQVTVGKNAKTLTPAHVKQCILAESRFDFLRDLVKNIPDISAAEEKETISAESSPTSLRFPEMSVPPRRIVREDSNSSSSSEIRVQNPREPVKRALSTETDLPKKIERTETVTSTIVSTDAAIDLTKKKEERPRMANFYQETLIEPAQHKSSVIKVNPSYASPQPSTSFNTTHGLDTQDLPKQDGVKLTKLYIDVPMNSANVVKKKSPPPRTPVTPILNIDFSKSIANPEIKVIDGSATIVKTEKVLQRQNSKNPRPEIKKETRVASPMTIDYINSGNLQIDEDYDT